jgi:hypothetical protein
MLGATSSTCSRAGRLACSSTGWWTRPLEAHDTWGQGLTGDPTAELIGAQQHVWAQGATGVQHWYWDPTTNRIVHDSWGP